MFNALSTSRVTTPRVSPQQWVMPRTARDHASLTRLLQAAAERQTKPVGKSALATLLGESPQTITNWASRGVSDQGALKAQRTHGISASWVVDGVEPMLVAPEATAEPPSPLTSDDSDWGDIEGYAQAVGLSEGVEAQEYAETHKLKFRADSLRKKRLNPRNLAVFYGDGDSMEPRIHSGDAVLFDQSDTRPRDGQLYVILVPGAGAESYTVKRCELLDDLVLFKADNPKGDHGWKKPRRMDDPKRPIKIIGRVRWIGSWEG